MTHDELVASTYLWLQDGPWAFTSHEHIRAVLKAAKVEKLLDGVKASSLTPEEAEVLILATDRADEAPNKDEIDFRQLTKARNKLLEKTK